MDHLGNVDFHRAPVHSIPLADGSQNFGYSLGVLHHIPDPAAGLRSCVAKLKRGAPFLLYVYYCFGNRPRCFRLVWRGSDLARRVISRMSFGLRAAASTTIAATAYWPLIRAVRVLRRLGVQADNIPLAFYADHDWATLRANALDRFGTAVEHRFSKSEVEAMMTDVGLRYMRFSEGPPYWTAVGFKV